VLLLHCNAEYVRSKICSVDSKMHRST